MIALCVTVITEEKTTELFTPYAKTMLSSVAGAEISDEAAATLAGYVVANGITRFAATWTADAVTAIASMDGQSAEDILTAVVGLFSSSASSPGLLPVSANI